MAESIIPEKQNKINLFEELSSILKQNMPLVIMALTTGSDISKILPVFVVPIVLCLVNYLTEFVKHLYSKKNLVATEKYNAKFTVEDPDNTSRYDLMFVNKISNFVFDFCVEAIHDASVRDVYETNELIENTNSYYFNPKLKLKTGFTHEFQFNGSRNGDSGTNAKKKTRAHKNSSIYSRMQEIGFVLPNILTNSDFLCEKFMISIKNSTTEKKNVKGEKITESIEYVEIKANNPLHINNLIKVVIAYDKFKLENIQNFRLTKITYNPQKDNTICTTENCVNVKKTFNNIFLSQKNKSLICGSLRAWTLDKDQMAIEGTPHKIGFLLYGEPGNGKSSLIYAVAQEQKKNIININLSGMNNIQFIKCISRISNSIVVFEDIDAHDFTHDREHLRLVEESKQSIITAVASGIIPSAHETIVNDTVKHVKESITNDTVKYIKESITIDTFLEVLDGYLYLQNCIVFITTNHPQIIDSAITRPGRIDHKIEFQMADAYQFNEIFTFYFKCSYKKIKKNYIFPENKYSTSYIINTVILPNRNNAQNVLQLLI